MPFSSKDVASGKCTCTLHLACVHVCVCVCVHVRVCVFLFFFSNFHRQFGPEIERETAVSISMFPVSLWVHFSPLFEAALYEAGILTSPVCYFVSCFFRELASLLCDVLMIVQGNFPFVVSCMPLGWTRKSPKVPLLKQLDCWRDTVLTLLTRWEAFIVTICWYIYIFFLLLFFERLWWC